MGWEGGRRKDKAAMKLALDKLTKTVPASDGGCERESLLTRYKGRAHAQLPMTQKDSL